MVTIIDEAVVKAPPQLCFRVAADVEQWPRLLPHYRWVRFQERAQFGTGRVEMAAWRDFGGPLRWPTWWMSQMHVDEAEPAIYFRHVRGITRGMDVKWAFLTHSAGTHIRLTHAWDGPPWPGIGRIAWRGVIAPYFVSAIARRTLAGIGREAERISSLEEAAS
jgi:ribosome-associated toxin RatA of RatAB toxin-antitoxin module